MLLTDLADACRKSGLVVTELPGWMNRSRPASSGTFNPSGVLVHHTGGAPDTREYADWMALTGRSDLPAPLCQLALSRKGVVYVSAAGRANHGGTAKASGPMPAGDANAMYIGVEAMNSGSEGWTPVQYRAYVALCAALCDHYGWPATHVRAHKETSVTGKVDPGLMDMEIFRADIAAEIANLRVLRRKPVRRTLRKVTTAIRQAKADGYTGLADRLKKVREAARKNHEQ